MTSERAGCFCVNRVVDRQPPVLSILEQQESAELNGPRTFSDGSPRNLWPKSLGA